MDPNSEAVVRGYLMTIEKSATKETLEAFLHNDIHQYEFPSRMNPNGRCRKKAEMLADCEKGKALLTVQEYRIKSLISDGNRVSAETEWVGTLAIPLGSLNAGDRMRVNFGVFFRIQDGKIIEQNNYDCIHPW